MKQIVSVLVMSLALFSIQTVSTNAATSKLSLTVLQTPGGDEPVVTLYGNLKPAKSAVKVEIQIQLNGKWQDTRFSARTAKVGTWKVVAVATAGMDVWNVQFEEDLVELESLILAMSGDSVDIVEM